MTPRFWAGHVSWFVRVVRSAECGRALTRHDVPTKDRFGVATTKSCILLSAVARVAMVGAFGPSNVSLRRQCSAYA